MNTVCTGTRARLAITPTAEWNGLTGQRVLLNGIILYMWLNLTFVN